MNSSTLANRPGDLPGSTLPPVVIDLGKLSRKKVKQLKKGKGVYADEVEPAIARVKASLEGADALKELLPVVVIYQKKPRKPKLPLLNLLS